MPWILKCLKWSARHASALLAAAGLLCICVSGGGIAWMLVPGIPLLMLAALNGATVRRMYRQREPFEPRSRVRNVDYLVIGDICAPEEVVPAGETFVQIAASNRSLLASYEILRHTSSILKERGGHVVLAVRRKSAAQNTYSLFDVGFLHPVTIERLGLKGKTWQRHLPALFAPLRSLRLALWIQHGSWKEAECPLQEIQSFCKERRIDLSYRSR